MPPMFESSNYRMSDEELEQLLKPKLDSDGRNVSKIAKFYDGRSVFVTGATGFVGRLLIEKLLRSCVNIKRVYILIRAKRGKTIEERLNELTGSVVFDSLRYLKINLKEKLVPIEGDLTESCYGLNEKQIIKLASEISVIFHSAASVNFQEPLRDASLTNIIGAYNAIKLGKCFPKLVSLVYVSTAYSNSNQRNDEKTTIEIDELVYPNEFDPINLIKMVDFLDRDAMELIKKHLIGQYPNTYTYTKNLAETLLLKYSKAMPIVICRPSVVICTLREPFKGFVDNINGGNGLNYGPATGLSVTMQANSNVILDYVPIDIVVNCIIALGWFCEQFHQFRLAINVKNNSTDNNNNNEKDLEKEKMEKFYKKLYFKQEKKRQQQKAQNLSITNENNNLINLPVFHCTSGMENPIKLGKFKNLMIYYANKYPTLQLYRRPKMTYWKSKQIYLISKFFQNTLLAKLMDMLYGYFDFLKPEIYDKNDTISRKSLEFRCERIDNFGQTIAYFLLNQWNFTVENRQMLVDEFMCDEDRRLFDCDMRKLDWNQYCEIYALGMRKFLLKEPMETLDKARWRYGLICVRNSTCKLTLIVILFFLIAKLLYFI